MKIRNLKKYGIPSYILKIWEKHYSPFLLPLQEEAVRNYGILDCGKGSDDEVVNQNLLVIAPTSSGKTFIGEMAAVYQVFHQKKTILIVPSRALAREKYWHFKSLYESCGLETVLFSRDRKEDDYRLIVGNYKLAVMSCEKFIYFLFKYPEFLNDVSLIVMDELQMIDNPRWGPLLEDILDQLLKKELINLRIIALSALIENQEALLRWFSVHPLISYQYPVEMRKGIVREGVFKYITSKENRTFKSEVFFKPSAVRDNCFKDYLLETVRHFIDKDEPTLIFFATSEETRKWASWLASQLESPAASSALRELAEMEETLFREELSGLLKKGIAYYNRNLSWEEKNLVETYLKKGEIKLVCSTATLSTGVNLPFKNIIVPLDKMHNYDENYPHNYRTGLSFVDIENMSGSAGVSGFGRVIFLAYSLLTETIFQNIYFNYPYNHNQGSIKPRIKKENDLLTFLLRLLSKHICRPEKIKKYLRGEGRLCGYWQFSFNQENLEEKIDNYLNILKENKLIKESEEDTLSPTINGILITAKKIKVETYLFLKTWMKYSKKGEVSDLEILLLLAFSPDGKVVSIPFSSSCRNIYRKERFNPSWEGSYWNKLLHLVLKQGDEDKKLYQDILMLKKEKEEKSIILEDYLAFKKTCLLDDWIKESKDIKTLEQEHGLCGGTIRILGETFSWLADSLAEIAENEGWRKSREKDLNKIKILSKRLIDGVEEEGLSLAKISIPGLSRYHIRRLVGAGYRDENSLRDASGGELGKLIPKRLVQRVQKRMKEDNNHQKMLKEKWIVQDEKLKAFKKVPEECGISISERQLVASASPVALLEPLLEISQRRSDRIIFMGKEIAVTSTEFSVIHLLAQHNERVMSYDELIDELWKDEKDVIYRRVNYHIFNIKKAILKTIGETKTNIERIKKILVVVPGRGIMLNLMDNELIINRQHAHAPVS